MKKRLMFLMSVLFVLTFGVSIKQPAMVCYAQEDDSDYDDDDDDSTNNKVFKVYSFRYAQDTDSELDQINKVLNQLKKKQRIEDEHKRISQIKITISQANYDKLKKNYQELYD